MASCTSPLRLPHRAEGGQRFSGIGHTVPCGKCISCCLNHARHWAVRITHETALHDSNCFLTLTYSDAALPLDRGLSKREFQLFLKRLRKAHEPALLRYFGCGEYGERTFRPHYHLIIFGVDFTADRKLWKSTPSGQLLYTSPLLDRIWGFGQALIGDVTLGSAQYVARYNVKKANSYTRGERYERHDEHGRSWTVEPEFLLMSRRPGIGAGWWDKFKSEVFPSDFIIIDGKRIPVPPYYRNRYNVEETNPDNLMPASFLTDSRRKAAALKHPEEQSTARRLTRDEVIHLRHTSEREPPDDL